MKQPRSNKGTANIDETVDRISGESTALLDKAVVNDADSENEVPHQPHALPPSAVSGNAGVQSMLPAIFPSVHTWKQQTLGERLVTLFSAPFLLFIGLTTITLRPQATGATGSHVMHEKMPLFVQLMLGLQLLGIVLTLQMGLPTQSLRFVCPSMCLFSITCVVATYRRGHYKACGLLSATVGFAVSLVWIFLTATSAVSLLKTLGLILRLSDAILGATIFAIGNSSNDLLANSAVAKRGLPMLAVSACFGGPMMNMLLGIGISALIRVVSNSATRSSPYSVYVFTVQPVMFVSAGILLGGLMMTLAYAFWNHWRLDRPLALALLSL